MKDMNRFVNFSDGVMAIAVTLLVLPLTEQAANVRIESLSDFNEQFGHLLLIFALSFVVICRYWQVHHNLLNTLKTFNTKLFWLNAAWLLSIALIPFTSEVIGNREGGSSVPVGIYIGSLLITGYVGLLMQVVAAKSPQLHKSAITHPSGLYHGTVSVLSITLAFFLAILMPDIGPLFLLLLIPGEFLARTSINIRGQSAHDRSQA